MSTWNTTYNYNMPNMNFGQALLTGVFGSLTGTGSGCFGGGYGVGSCGLGGSLFNMMGGYGAGSLYANPSTFFGLNGAGCCGSSNQGLGAMLGIMTANIGLAWANQAITDHKSRQADKANQVTKESLDAKAADNLKIISEVSASKITSLADFDSTKTASQYDYSTLDENITTANTEYAETQANTAKAKAELETMGGTTGPKITDDKYKKSETKDGVTTTTTDNDAFKKDYEEWANKKNEVARLEAIETKKKNAVTKAENERTTKESAVETAIKALIPLKEQYDEIKAADDKKAAEVKAKEQAKAKEKEAKAERKKDKENFETAWNAFKKDPQNATKKAAVDNALNDIDDEKLKAKYQNMVKTNPYYNPQKR